SSRSRRQRRRSGFKSQSRDPTISTPARSAIEDRCYTAYPPITKGRTQFLNDYSSSHICSDSRELTYEGLLSGQSYPACSCTWPLTSTTGYFCFPGSDASGVSAQPKNTKEEKSLCDAFSSEAETPAAIDGDSEPISPSFTMR